MPYFTKYKNGKVDAIYSGRFAFILPDSYENIVENFRKVTKENKILNFTERTKSLNEEFGHSIQFSKMPIGNALNGARWLIRQIYIYFPMEFLVSSYYKLRFIWFCGNYSLLEDMYKKSQDCTLSDNQKKKFMANLNTLFYQDLKSAVIMLKHFPILTSLLFISMPITVPIGFFLNRHFTVYALAVDKESIIEHGITSYTSSLEKHKKFARIMRIIVVLVQHGYVLKKRPWILKNWVHIKLKTEKTMYEKFSHLNSSNPAFPDFNKYINSISAFAIKWSGCNDLKKSMEISNELKNLSKTKEVNLDKINALNAFKDWENTIGFFYMHGN